MNDFFRLGGKSEFYGKSLEDQKEKIKKGLEIFKKNNIKIRSFFAPNHTYDLNTFEALKQCGLYEVIDGYGIKPYNENGIIFIPQLFYRLLIFLFFIKLLKFILMNGRLMILTNLKSLLKIKIR